jgi:hypothetical protein
MICENLGRRQINADRSLGVTSCPTQSLVHELMENR